MKQWNVTDVNGTTHTVGYGKGFSKNKIIVDGETYKVKSSNWFINVIDYSIDFPGTNCHIVVIGNSAKLSVNGTFLDNGKPYEPVSGIPAWIWVLVGLSVIGGYFFGGLLCLAIGCAMSVFYLQAGLHKKTGLVIVLFLVFLVIAALCFWLNLNFVMNNSYYY